VKELLLCCDLDRTLLPNGEPPESPGVRRLFARLVERPEVTLAYVSGRSKALMLEAIDTFDIPVPAFAIGDVGTTLYEIDSGEWRRSESWEEQIAPDWKGRTYSDLAELLEDLDGLDPQEQEQQERYKVSFYVSLDADKDALLQQAQNRIDAEGLRASLIWSVDEERGIGLLDVLPEQATKLHAVRFLRDRLELDDERTVFAGDSGNDLPALTSELQAVLVANASEEVRREAWEEARRKGRADRLYLARGDFFGFNGNYAAGVLEGLVHYVPDARETVERLIRS
jgi:sucrose-6F-phosphate phosphohydrolase